MRTAELTAHRIYDTYHLGELPDEVKRQLVILFMSEPTVKHSTYSYAEALGALTGSWADNGMTAEEEIAEIYNARQSGVTRKVVDL